jgi:DNA-binding response OmpR family regulator
LVVEDDPDLRHALREVIERAGYDVITAADGREALAHISGRATPVALILLDWLLPVMPAPALLARIALDTRHCSTPVLVLSGHDRIAPADLGVTAVLMKPVRTRTLITVIDRLAGRPGGTERQPEPRPSSSTNQRADSPRQTARTLGLRRTDRPPW